jgi:hypothetical protein
MGALGSAPMRIEERDDVLEQARLFNMALPPNRPKASVDTVLVEERIENAWQPSPAADPWMSNGGRAETFVAGGDAPPLRPIVGTGSVAVGAGGGVCGAVSGSPSAGTRFFP